MTLFAGRFSTSSGTVVHVSQLVIPANASNALLMDSTMSPAPELTGEFRSQALVSLGARSRASNEDIKRACSIVAAAAKSGWTQDPTAQSLKHVATAAAAVECLPSLETDVQGELDADAIDAAARSLAAAAQLMACASLSFCQATLSRYGSVWACLQHIRLYSHHHLQCSSTVSTLPPFSRFTCRTRGSSPPKHASLSTFPPLPPPTPSFSIPHPIAGRFFPPRQKCCRCPRRCSL